MRRLLFLAAVALAAACARLPTSVTGDIVQAPSPNFDERRPNVVVIHQTSNNAVERSLATLRSPDRKVSAHYLIGRDGATYQLVGETSRAWHAGVSYWGGSTDLNSASIGIELDNDGEEPFAEAQIARLLEVLRDLKERYRIPQANFLGHGDVAPGRKVDPSALFPWRRLADAGYGLWCYEPLPEAGEVVDVNLGLRILGYDVSNPMASLMAFRRHFAGIESAAEPQPADRAMLSCLLRAKSAQP